jgi:putrescine aminotransferase
VASGPKLLSWHECATLEIATVRDYYRTYGDGHHADLLGAFGFGRVGVVSAEGIYVFTADGRRIYDFSGGDGQLTHGHNHQRIVAARIEYQRQHRMEVHGTFLSQYVAGLSHNIAQLLPDGLTVSHFRASAGEALEDAMELAFGFHGGRRRYVLSGDLSGRCGPRGLARSVPPDSTNGARPPSRSVEVATFAHDDLESLERELARLRTGAGRSDVCAVLVAPFDTGNVRPCSRRFLCELRRRCTEEGIVLIFDETGTGWGRTGELFHFMVHGIAPDILAIAQSLGGGKSAIAGFVTHPSISRRAPVPARAGGVSGEECATAIEAINVAVEDDYPQRARRIFARLHPGLLRLQQKYPDAIAEVRGRGALNAIVLNVEVNAALRAVLAVVPSRTLREPVRLARLLTAAVISELFNTHDVLTFHGRGQDAPLLVSPPLIASDEEIDYFLDALDATLAQGRLALLRKFVSYKYSNQSTVA